MFAQVPKNRLAAIGPTVAGELPADATDLTRLFAANSNLLRWDLVQGLPFAATGRIALEKPLADGRTVSNSYDVSCWRDSKGRRRVEYEIKTPNSKRTSRVVTVWDPVNRTVLNWTSGDQADYTVVISHVPLTANLQDSVADTSRHNDLPKADSERIHTENLPSDMIARLHVEGVKTTWSVPDDRKIPASSEIWISHELKIIVRQITNDPGSGNTITELTHVDRFDPNPALFQPPQGYHVKDLARQHLVF